MNKHIYIKQKNEEAKSSTTNSEITPIKQKMKIKNIIKFSIINAK